DLVVAVLWLERVHLPQESGREEEVFPGVLAPLQEDRPLLRCPGGALDSRRFRAAGKVDDGDDFTVEQGFRSRVTAGSKADARRALVAVLGRDEEEDLLALRLWPDLAQVLPVGLFAIVERPEL